MMQSMRAASLGPTRNFVISLLQRKVRVAVALGTDRKLRPVQAIEFDASEPEFEITDCDFKASRSSASSWNMK